MANHKKHNGIIALPIWGIELIAYKPKPIDYPYNPVTLGDHLKKKRIDSGMLGKDLSKELEIHESQRKRWEENRAQPRNWNVEKLKKYLKLD